MDEEDLSSAGHDISKVDMADPSAMKPQSSLTPVATTSTNAADQEQIENDNSESSEGSEDGETTELSPEEEMQARLAKYRWYKLTTDPTVYDLSAYPAHYFLHANTHESIWVEPDEPYWLWDYASASPDQKAGLQFPDPDRDLDKQAGASIPPKESQGEWQGYNPKVHGNYDPSAPYAQYHKQLHATDYSQAAPASTIRDDTDNAETYTSSMPLNRYTGQVQANSDLSADRHTDAAKSQRHLNAFFDADAAANMHGGKSLKEDRRNKKFSGDEIKAFNKARREKKDKKRKAFLLS